MQPTTRRVAVVNLVFNSVGVLLFVPFISQFAAAVEAFAGEPGMAVAWAHLIFNLSMAAVMLVLLRLFAGWTLDDWPFARKKRKT